MNIRYPIYEGVYRILTNGQADRIPGSGSAGFVLGELFAQDRGERPDEIRDRFR